jgi:nucleoside-diphosphate-sugar epimerase
VSAVAVIGASGVLGRLVVSGLAANYERVVAIDRTPGGAGSPTVRHLRIDVLAEPNRLREALEGVSDVVHLAFVPEDGDHRTLRAVLSAAGDVGVEHVTLVSSAMVYGAWPNNPVPISEDAPVRPNPSTVFAVRKADAERTLLAWRDAVPTRRVAILRPAAAAAESGSSLIGEAMLAAAPIRTGTDDPPVQFVHLEDLASAVVIAAADRLDGAFNVAPDGWLSATELRALLGARPKIRVPIPLPRRLDRHVSRRVGRPMPTGLLPYTRYPWVVANDRLRAHGWRPRYGNDQVFVAADAGLPWDSMNARQRQYVSLATGAVLLVAGAGWLVWMVRRWRRATVSAALPPRR